MSTNVDIYVSGGNLSSPYYQFFLDSSGNNEISSLNLNSNLTYTFRRLDEETSHPFFISDSGVGNDSSSSISISGNGSATSGISGDQSFTLTFNKEQTEISELTFYCTSHSSMQSSFNVVNWDPPYNIFTTRTVLDRAVDLWISNEASATETYGDINTWDVSAITDFTFLFSKNRIGNVNAGNFNSDISNWDLSSAEDITEMFRGAKSFNQDISSWDVSSVKAFSKVFMNANSFNQDLGSWDVSKGTNFYECFAYAYQFNQDVGSWDVSNGDEFRLMFKGATSFNQDIGNWDVGNGENFQQMFVGASSFNQDIGNWDVEKGSDFSYMFALSSSFDQDISSWVVGAEANISYMFSGATSMIEGQGVSATPDRSYFVGPVSITLDVSDHQTGTNYQLEYIKDYDGNLHANTGSVSDTTKSAYKYQGLIDVNADGTKEAIYTNKESGRWVTGSINSSGEIDYSEHGKGGITRVVGIYIDPLVTSGEVEQFGPHDSQRRFQNDLLIDNLTVKTSGDYDSDGFQEVYWKTNDGTAYLRALMHADGNIQYANYQSEEQMSDYLTSKGYADVINDIV